jgi:type II secretory pathway pseudopilin PulG
VVVAIAAFFLISSQSRKDSAVESAASQVGQAASDVGDAAKDAAGAAKGE